jgi:hypothetical protein
MRSQRVINGYLESESALKSQKVIQKNHLKEKLSQKRSGKILHGGFLHSQLSPVRRKKRLPGGSWPWENPWTPAIRLRLIANQNRHMENQKQKGRPPKEKGTAKRDHFSVWVSADQKRQINELIERSGLSASQFFLTLALDIPFKRPAKRTLPRATADTIRILEQLAGVLSLAALKTKGHQMLSGQWQQSSQRVRLLADLITLWVFESFEIRSMEKAFDELLRWSNELSSYLSEVLSETEGKHRVLIRCSATSRLIGDLQHKYEAYYSQPLEELAPLWKSGETDALSVHAEIEKALSATMKKMKL